MTHQMHHELWFFCLFVERPYRFHLPNKVDGFPRPRGDTRQVSPSLAWSGGSQAFYCIARAVSLTLPAPEAAAAAHTAPPSPQLRVVTISADPRLAALWHLCRQLLCEVGILTQRRLNLVMAAL